MDGFRAYLKADGHLAPTQELAGKGATQTVVPYKKADLITFVNETYDRGRADQKDGEALLGEVMTREQIVNSNTPEAQAKASALMNPERGAWTAQSVMEWVLDEASINDVEQLFTRLGTRFAELRNEAAK